MNKIKQLRDKHQEVNLNPWKITTRDTIYIGMLKLELIEKQMNGNINDDYLKFKIVKRNIFEEFGNDVNKLAKHLSDKGLHELSRLIRDNE